MCFVLMLLLLFVVWVCMSADFRWLDTHKNGTGIIQRKEYFNGNERVKSGDTCISATLKTL